MAKYRHETQFENYLFDMLWAPANGMQYKDARRYRELTMGQQEEEQSGDEIVADLITNLENK